jgi:hypothetical protein
MKFKKAAVIFAQGFPSDGVSVHTEKPGQALVREMTGLFVAAQSAYYRWAKRWVSDWRPQNR